ncbi:MULTISPECIES: hypothetical protein [unclassified Luteococcus]|uniref:hypothetical protein n=1 Tax=unclassified Luteococcus TaxID=2639923 RepID=UPI00313CEDA8
MRRYVSVAVTTAAISGVALAAPLPANAGYSASSPACGTLVVNSTTPGDVDIVIDGVPRTPTSSTRTNQTFAGLTAGNHVWRVVNQDLGEVGSGVTAVRGCPGAPRPSAPGDHTGDGRADVFGIQAGTGDLYFYRSTASGLARGVRVGTGWQRMLTLEQTSNGAGNRLLAMRDDASLWEYSVQRDGRLGSARQVSPARQQLPRSVTALGPFSAHGLGGPVLLTSNGTAWRWETWRSEGVAVDAAPARAGSWNTSVPASAKPVSVDNLDGDAYADLLAIKADGTLWAEKLLPPGQKSTLRQLGHGWQAMQLVTSPGSLNGDQLSDLVARRSDGNLYQYLNRGGSWATGVQIGRNWNRIRLLA